MDATVAISDSTSARLRQRMKSMFVWSGTSLSSFISRASNVERPRACAADPERNQHAREIDGGEHRGDDADEEHDREAADRARTEIGHNRRRDDVGHVGVEDGAEGLVITG